MGGTSQMIVETRTYCFVGDVWVTTMEKRRDANKFREKSSYIIRLTKTYPSSPFPFSWFPYWNERKAAS